MRVGFVHPTYPQGEGTGATHSASRIVFELADRGHDVTAYCWADPPDDASFAADISVRPLDTDGYPYHSALQLDAALRGRLDEFDAYDVVHSYVMNSLPALGEVAAETTAATVLTLNAYGAVCPKNDLRYMDREPCSSNGLAKCAACSVATSGGHDEDGPLYRSASRLGYLKLVRDGERVADRIDGYHALSPHIRETYADFGFPRDRLSVIPNVLDERFDGPHESDFEAPYDLLYVGSLDEHKGVDRLVPVLDRLNRSGDGPFRLTVVGDGGLRTDLEAAAEKRGLDEAVTFTGWLDNDDLPALYAAHDCFLYPGRWDEPFGRVFLEALAAGTPVVASDVGSVAEIVGDGGRVTDGSVEGFATAIRELFDGDAAATSAAAKRTVERYRADAVVPQFEELYERAVERSDADEP
ncbi:glycosyltransferase family 4 protein [Halosimplex pelagicum]|uniref:Glycosyltransferase family 4 protein n=1 Tax=Halosimplex pelagicum TaxID=869886 RepID=A0A7D5TA76_9EURY|nr:glycosyltransferase family 4 protein [Halosimplex pelagicum]QLH81133.1 glycosyltransferase family 4 protein [Halosimplex pelagicum]